MPTFKRSKRTYRRRPRRAVRKYRKSFPKYLRPEVKRIDSTYATGITSTEATILLNGLTQGLEYNQRIGRKITSKSIAIRGYVQNADANVNQVRLLLVYDKQTNQALPTMSDIIDGNLFNGFRNLDNIKRFKILSDRRMALQVTADSGVRYFKMYKKIRLDTIYDDTTSNINAITSGSIILFLISTDATTGVTSNIDWRFTYTDV